MPRFFAVAASVTMRRAQHERGQLGPSLGGCVTPCALRLGEPHPHVATSDVLCRLAGAPARAPPRAFAFPSSPVFRQDRPALTFETRPRACATRLRVSAAPRPRRLLSTRFSISRSSEAHARSIRWHALPRTLSPDADGAPSVTGRLLRRATPRPLGSPRGSPWRREKDASRRPLQPTHDTSTLGPYDSRARDESR